MQLNAIKGRSQKPYIVLLGSYMQVEQFAYLPKAVYLQQLFKACWPGPLTVILNLKIDRLSFLKSEKNTIAIRIPDHPGLLSLLQRMKGFFRRAPIKLAKRFLSGFLILTQIYGKRLLV